MDIYWGFLRNSSWRILVGMETMAVVQRDISKPWWNLRRNSDWNHLRCSEGNANIKIPLGEIAGGTPREIQKEAPGEISKELWETIEDEFLQKSREKFLKKSRKVQEDVWKKQSQENHNGEIPWNPLQEISGGQILVESPIEVSKGTPEKIPGESLPKTPVRNSFMKFC